MAFGAAMIAAPTWASWGRFLDRHWWARYLDAMASRFPNWTHGRQPQKTSSMFFPSGTAGLRYQVGFAWPTGAKNYLLRVGLYMGDGSKWFHQFQARAEEIEDSLGSELAELLQWEEIPDAVASRVAIYLEPVIPSDRDSWTKYRAFALDALEKLSEAFRPVIRPIVK